MEPREELQEHHAEAFAWALTCCNGDRATAEDVLQTSYLKVLDGRARFAGHSSFRTWLFSIIRHTSTDSWRSAWRSRARSLTQDDYQRPQPAPSADRLELSEIADALADLAPRQQQVLTLVYGHGMTLIEASKVLKISQGSAANHLHRGKAKLRERFGDEGRGAS